MLFVKGGPILAYSHTYMGLENAIYMNKPVIPKLFLACDPLQHLRFS